MPALAAPNVGNYTFGAHSLIAGGVNLGNIVNAVMAVEVTPQSHFSATAGEEVEDQLIVRRLRYTIEATLDEPNKDNLFRFMLADATGKVGKLALGAQTIVFAGIPVVGNAFSWAIPKAVVRPNGNFGYGSEDWSSFGLTIILIPDAASPTEPFGTVTHTGVA